MLFSKKNSAQTKKNLIFAELIFATFVFVILLYFLNALSGLEKNLYDIRFRYKHNVKKHPAIRYIDIDDYSFVAINEKWPWTRDYYAAIIDALSFGEAKTIAFDIFFDVPSSENPQYDDALARSIADSKRVFLASFMSLLDFNMSIDEFKKQGGHIFKPDTYIARLLPRFSIPEPAGVKTYTAFDARFPIPKLLENVAGLGFAQVVPDKDGITRRYPLVISYLGRTYFALGLAMAMDYLKVPKENVIIKPGKYILLKDAQIAPNKKKDIRIPINQRGEMLITWAGKWRDKSDFKHHSFYDVLREYVSLQETGEIGSIMEDIAGKICVIGATATGLHDLNPIPLQPRYPMVGAHANVLNTILTQQFMKEAPRILNIFLILVLAVVVYFIYPVARPFQSFLAMLALLVGNGITNFFLFINRNFIINLIYPTLFLVLSYLIVVVYRYMTEEKEKRAIKNTFQRYVTPSVVNVLLSNPDKLKLGGEKKILTVLFSDIRGFTTISESLPPEDVVALLNEYLSAMTEIIFQYEGMLDKYVGDEIMAVFGAPVEQPDHAQRACMTALKMMDKLHELQNKWKEEGKPILNIGIGINTGPMIIGNMGSQIRMDYTVMGDAVNLGARLEGTNKIYGTNIIISEFTYEYVKEQFIVRPLDLVRVKGKTKPVKIYELLDVKE